MANSSFTVAGQAAVSSVATGTGLRGGPITSSGTINTSTQFANCYRLSLTSATPVTTNDVAGASTLYLVPYTGLDIDVYTGSVWARFQPGQLSITNAGLSVNTVYDVFVDYNSGTPQLSLTAWSSSGPGTSTRATSLGYQDGVLCLGGTPTKRYIGTVATNPSTQFNDTKNIRSVWNYYNRVNKSMLRQETANSWTYTSPTIRQANNNTDNQLNFVIGVVEDSIDCKVHALTNNSSVAGTIAGIGINSTTVNSAQIYGITTNGLATTFQNCYCSGVLYPVIGSNYLAWLEASEALGTTTWIGTNANAAFYQTGINATIRC